MADKPGHYKKNIVLLLATVVLILICAEAALRLWALRLDNKYFMDKERAQERFRQTTATEVVRPLAGSDMVFTLKPSISFDYYGARVTTNRDGFRDRDYETQKPTGTRRIVGIGDSLMFGQGVEEQQSYLSIIEAYLDQSVPSRRWEAINLALPDYNTPMEVAALEEFGLKYAPDLVVVGFYPNDFNLPWALRTRADYLSLRTSFLAGFVRHRLEPGSPVFSPAEEGERHTWHSGREAFDRAIKRLRELSARHGFRVLFYVMAPATGKRDAAANAHAMEAARQAGFYVLDSGAAMTGYLRQNSEKQYPGSSLTLPDGHPSAIAHGIAALDMAGYMKASGLLKLLSATSTP